MCTFKQMGFSLLAVGVDTVFLQSAATAELEKLLQA
jgi:2-keto-3-deoxy-L-rhamnonate aldolase RhmA